MAADNCSKKFYQNQVHQHSSKWDTFCPIFISRETFLGFNWKSQKWATLPSLGFLPRHFYEAAFWSKIDHNLILVAKENSRGDNGQGPDIHVVNIVTRIWTQLPAAPPNPGFNQSHVGEKWVIPKSLEHYQVVVFHEYDGYLFAEVFCSRTGTWTASAKLLEWRDYTEHIVSPTWVYNNEKMYRLIGPTATTWELLTFNLESCSFERMNPSYSLNTAFSQVSGVMLGVGHQCLLLVVMTHPVSDIWVLKVILDGDSGPALWSEVTGPQRIPHQGLPVFSGTKIFFLGAHLSEGISVLDIEGNRLSNILIPPLVHEKYDGSDFILPQGKFQWEISSYTPGMLPFASAEWKRQ